MCDSLPGLSSQRKPLPLDNRTTLSHFATERIEVDHGESAGNSQYFLFLSDSCAPKRAHVFRSKSSTCVQFCTRAAVYITRESEIFSLPA